MQKKSYREKFFFFKYSLVKPNAIQYLRQLEHDQHLSPTELETLNWQRTQKLLQYAYDHTAYYRRRFQSAGITPQDIRVPEDYELVPVLTRQDLMENFDDMLSDEATLRDVRLSTTGGSSGTPARVYHQKNVVRAATGWRMLGWWGISPAADWASVYRDVRTNWKSRVMHFLQWWPTKNILLNATSFSEEDMQRFLQQFQQVKPELLHGYVGAVDVLAGYMLDNNIQVPAPKAIWLTSAPITPVQQKRIESAFGAPVYDQYGSCEMYWLAAECPKREGLHMFHDIRRFEFLDVHHHNVPNGEYGDIAVTDLENYYFPLIRYLNGDRGRRLDKKCSCGCNLPLMDKVKGRVSETFTLPSGKRLNGEFLTTLFDNTPTAVKQFQVHQLKDASIVIRVIPNENFQDVNACLEIIQRNLENAILHEVPVTLEKVEQIPQRGGKLKFVISDYTAQRFTPPPRAK